MERAQGRRKDRPVGAERKAEQAVEKRGEVMPEDARLGQPLQAADQERVARAAGALAISQAQAHQQQAARLAGKLATQEETQPPRQP